MKMPCFQFLRTENRKYFFYRLTCFLVFCSRELEKCSRKQLENEPLNIWYCPSSANGEVQKIFPFICSFASINKELNFCNLCFHYLWISGVIVFHDGMQHVL